jgi:hypothetical protein
MGSVDFDHMVRAPSQTAKMPIRAKAHVGIREGIAMDGTKDQVGVEIRPS